MSFISIGDLASSFSLNRDAKTTSRSIDKLTKEFTTGQTSDVRKAVNSDFSAISGHRRNITILGSREKTLTESLHKADMKQNILEKLGDDIIKFANDTSISLSSNQDGQIEAMSRRAGESLQQLISSVNSTVAGNVLFSGAATKQAALADFDDLMTSVRTAVAGSVTATDVIAKLAAWMSDPASGYPVAGYLGSADDAGPIRVSETYRVELPGSARDGAIKSSVYGFLLGALASDPSLNLQSSVQRSLMETSASALRNSDQEVTKLRGEIGYTQDLLTRAKVKTSYEKSMSEQFMLDALGVDQYETATRLQGAQDQLERIYTLTARSAKMSLLEFL
jgi:flagellar hook-associated protein 3 FlgL